MGAVGGRLLQAWIVALRETGSLAASWIGSKSQGRSSYHRPTRTAHLRAKNTKRRKPYGSLGTSRRTNSPATACSALWKTGPLMWSLDPHSCSRKVSARSTRQPSSSLAANQSLVSGIVPQFSLSKIYVAFVLTCARGGGIPYATDAKAVRHRSHSKPSPVESATTKGNKFTKSSEQQRCGQDVPRSQNCLLQFIEFAGNSMLY